MSNPFGFKDLRKSYFSRGAVILLKMGYHLMSGGRILSYVLADN